MGIKSPLGRGEGFGRRRSREKGEGGGALFGGWGRERHSKKNFAEWNFHEECRVRKGSSRSFTPRGKSPLVKGSEFLQLAGHLEEQRQKKLLSGRKMCFREGRSLYWDTENLKMNDKKGNNLIIKVQEKVRSCGEEIPPEEEEITFLLGRR